MTNNVNDGYDEPANVVGHPNGDSEGRHRSTGRRLVAVATGTTIALGAGGIAWAATSPPSTSPPSTSPSVTPPNESVTPQMPIPDGDCDGPLGGRFEGHGPGGLPFAGGPFGGMALHGEQVVETSDGVYETIATQRGTVDAISADALTVTSEDGFTRSYVLITDSLIDERSDKTVDIAVGDEVVAVATVDGTEATVSRAINLDALPTAVDGLPFHHDGPGRHGTAPDGVPNESDAPTPSATVEGSSA